MLHTTRAGFVRFNSLSAIGPVQSRSMRSSCSSSEGGVEQGFESQVAGLGMVDSVGCGMGCGHRVSTYIRYSKLFLRRRWLQPAPARDEFYRISMPEVHCRQWALGFKVQASYKNCLKTKRSTLASAHQKTSSPPAYARCRTGSLAETQKRRHAYVLAMQTVDSKPTVQILATDSCVPSAGGTEQVGSQ